MGKQYQYLWGAGELVLLYVFSVGSGEFISWLPRYIQKNLPIAIREKEEDTEKVTIEIPTFLGQLIGGFILVNLPGALLGDIDPTASSYIRKLCLSVILIRAGLGLDIHILRTVGAATLLLSCIPCTLEATLAAVLCRAFQPAMPWGFCFVLGFVQCAVSPAVVVPNVVALNEGGYGVEKGIPTMILAATSIDVLISVTGIGVSVYIAFNELSEDSGGNNELMIKMIILVVSIIAGVCIGCSLGLLQALLTAWTATAPQGGLKRTLGTDYVRTGLLLGLSMAVVVVSVVYQLESGAYLATMTMAVMAANEWNQIKPDVNEQDVAVSEKDFSMEPVSKLCKEVWFHGQPILLSLIGAQVVVTDIDPSVVLVSLAILFIAVTIRLIVTYLSMTASSDFTVNERLFVAISWLPKATAQAAFGSVALDAAADLDDDSAQSDGERYGKLILTTAVLAILITAPIGAIAIPIMGPKLLDRSKRYTEDNEEENDSSSSTNSRHITACTNSKGSRRPTTDTDIDIDIEGIDIDHSIGLAEGQHTVRAVELQDTGS
jgi:NhaP-type Na+/H+ or K+/H+ antiporter